MMPLPAESLPRLRKLLPLLASDKAGEVVAAAAAIGRTLETAGATWHDLTAALSDPPRVIFAYRDPPRPSPGRATWGDLLAMASEIAGHPDLSTWEAGFVPNVLKLLQRGYPLSIKQRRLLERIWARVIGVGEAV